MWDSIHYLYGRSRWLILLYSDQYQRDTDHYEKVPKLFGIIYYFYASQNLSLSKKIKKDFKCKKRLMVNDKDFCNFLYKKINFINRTYLDLKENGFKKGMYRFSWYLN